MKKIKWQLYRYYRQVRSWLPCGWRTKNRMIRELSQSIRDFMEQNPQADMDAIKERFGTPQQIASAFVDTTDTGTLLKSLRIRRWAVSAILVVITTALVMLAVLYDRGLKKIDKTFGGYIVTEIEILDNTVNSGGE